MVCQSCSHYRGPIQTRTASCRKIVLMIAAWKTFATKYNLKLLAYEGGSSYF